MVIATTFFNHVNIKGGVEFEEKGGKVIIRGVLKSNKYKNSSHGFHTVSYTHLTLPTKRIV